MLRTKRIEKHRKKARYQRRRVKSLLLVECHTAFRQALSLLLDLEPDLEVVGQAGSLAEARGSLLDRFDVMVLDLFLPDGSGTILIEEVRQAAPHLSTVVLTGSVDPDLHAFAREAGAEEVLTKGLGIQEVLDTIRRTAQKG